MIEWLISFDKDLFLTLNGLHNGFFDFLMWWISKGITWLPLHVLVAYLLIKQYGVKGWIIMLFTAVLITMTDQSSVQLFKNVFERLRPCHNPEFEGLVHIVNNKCGGKYGFVSSHSANYFGIFTYMFLWLRKSHPVFSWFLILCAAIIAYSRVYLGVHYPADIVGGALLGVACAFIAFYMCRFLLSRLPLKKASA